MPLENLNDRLDRFSLKKSIKYIDKKVNLFDIPSNIKLNSNINCEDLNGIEIWRIKDINPLEDFPFVDIIYIDENKFKACNWKGVNYYVDIKTGDLQLVHKQRY